MPTYADDTRNRPLTEADLDEAIDLWESVSRELENTKATVCLNNSTPEAEPRPDQVLEATRIERVALTLARAKFRRMKINGSKDLLPS